MDEIFRDAKFKIIRHETKRIPGHNIGRVTPRTKYPARLSVLYRANVRLSFSKQTRVRLLGYERKS